MSLHVGELRTEIVSEPVANAAPQARDERESWEGMQRFRVLHARFLRERARTKAEGFDD